MPIIQSAKKQMRQNRVKRARNFPVRNKLKTLFKNQLKAIKDGNLEEAKKNLGMVYSMIDVACKKKIIHPNNAARKKSRLARAINLLEKGGDAKAAPAKKEEKAEEKSEA